MVSAKNEAAACFLFQFRSHQARYMGIGQLGSLAMSLKNSLNATNPTSQTSPPVSTASPSDGQQISEILGNLDRIRLGIAEANYVEGGHWTAILDEVSRPHHLGHPSHKTYRYQNSKTISNPTSTLLLSLKHNQSNQNCPSDHTRVPPKKIF